MVDPAEVRHVKEPVDTLARSERGVEVTRKGAMILMGPGAIEIVDLPIKNCDFPSFFVPLPEGNPHYIPINH